MMTFHFLYTSLVFYLLIMNSVPNFCLSLKYCFRMLTLSLKVFSQGPSLYSALLQSRLVRFCLWQAVILGSPARKSGGLPLLFQYVGSPISHISYLPFLIDFFKLVAHIFLKRREWKVNFLKPFMKLSITYPQTLWAVWVSTDFQIESDFHVKSNIAFSLPFLWVLWVLLPGHGCCGDRLGTGLFPSPGEWYPGRVLHGGIVPTSE